MRIILGGAFPTIINNGHNSLGKIVTFLKFHFTHFGHFFLYSETNLDSLPLVDTHSKRTLLIKTVETRDGQVGIFQSTLA